jgi:hypothetical protein
MIRRHVVETVGCPDWPVALAEDLLTLLSSLLAIHIVSS